MSCARVHDRWCVVVRVHSEDQPLTCRLDDTPAIHEVLITSPLRRVELMRMARSHDTSTPCRVLDWFPLLLLYYTIPVYFVIVFAIGLIHCTASMDDVTVWNARFSLDYLRGLRRALHRGVGDASELGRGAVRSWIRSRACGGQSGALVWCGNIGVCSEEIELRIHVAPAGRPTGLPIRDFLQ